MVNNRCMLSGRYPDLSLADARKKHREAKDLVRKGINPTLYRRNKKQANRAKERVEKAKRKNRLNLLLWIGSNSKKVVWGHDHAVAVLGTLKNDVFKAIGDKPVDSISTPEV